MVFGTYSPDVWVLGPLGTIFAQAQGNNHDCNNRTSNNNASKKTVMILILLLRTRIVMMREATHRKPAAALEHNRLSPVQELYSNDM